MLTLHDSRASNQTYTFLEDKSVMHWCLIGQNAKNEAEIVDQKTVYKRTANFVYSDGDKRYQ